jgi:hypothetical protein
MQRSRAKQAAQGRKQIAVNLSPEALSSLEALCLRYETDRSKALDALLTGKIKLPKQSRGKIPQTIDSEDLFSQYRKLVSGN